MGHLQCDCYVMQMLLMLRMLAFAIAAGGLARWTLLLERGERAYLRRCC